MKYLVELWLYSDLCNAHFDEKGSNLVCNTSINLKRKKMKKICIFNIVILIYIYRSKEDLYI